jgi:hypothetical protein
VVGTRIPAVTPVLVAAIIMAVPIATAVAAIITVAVAIITAVTVTVAAVEGITLGGSIREVLSLDMRLEPITPSNISCARALFFEMLESTPQWSAGDLNHSAEEVIHLQN